MKLSFGVPAALANLALAAMAVAGDPLDLMPGLSSLADARPTAYQKYYDASENVNGGGLLGEDKSSECPLHDAAALDGDCDDCCDERLFGLFTRSDHCSSGYISPMTNPLFFEDPRTLTEARLIFAHHKLPPALANGDVQLVAMQLRAALNESWSIIAAKDGFIFAGSDAPHDDGWADVSAGLKYNFYADYDSRQLLSAGATYELPVGSRVALQARGSGEFHVFLSAATPLVGEWQYITGTGLRLPCDTVDNSQMWYWSHHIDRPIFNYSYLFFECNWFNWINSGGTGLAGAPQLEGNDLYNLGAPDVNGNSIVSGAVGLKFKPHEHTEIGVAFEVPLTERRDLLESRLTVDWILRY